MENRVTGSLIGLVCGDAVGTSLEFKPRGSFTPIDDMIGGGPFNLLPGEWTDDTSMALCLAESLLYKQGFDAQDQMNRYCDWYRSGYMSCKDYCFDIGVTVATALKAYMATGNPFSGSVDPMSSGNGSLMRLAPIAMVYRHNKEKLIHFAGESSRTTHASEESIDGCKYFALLISNAFNVQQKRDLIKLDYQPLTKNISAISKGEFLDKSYQDIKGSGYIVQSLEAALWCFYKTDNFRDAILMSANLGDDADTTAAICGQIAGAFYGLETIPIEWRRKIAWSEDIHDKAKKLYELGDLIDG
jgi:ADP-ribosyl-[dinitrogen reductase] hydrolase